VAQAEDGHDEDEVEAILTFNAIASHVQNDQPE
jgi:hypothetical protein